MCENYTNEILTNRIALRYFHSLPLHNSTQMKNKPERNGESSHGTNVFDAQLMRGIFFVVLILVTTSTLFVYVARTNFPPIVYIICGMVWISR